MPRGESDCHAERPLLNGPLLSRERPERHLTADRIPPPKMWPPSSPLDFLLAVRPELGGPTTDASGRPLRTAGAICHTPACFVMSCVRFAPRARAPVSGGNSS